MKTELFEFVQTKLAGITSIKHFDWWNNQPNTEEEEDGFECPAVFIEILPHTVNALGRKRLTAEIEFVLHLVQQPTKRTVRGHRQQAEALRRLKTDALIKALKGKNNGATIGSLSLVYELPDNNYKLYNDNRVQFKTRMVSDVAVLPTVPLPDGVRGEVDQINP